jgi:Ca2+-binding RTX toxin-like protein
MVRGGPEADALTARELDGKISIAVGEEGALRAAGVEELVVSLGAGDDTFDGAGSALLGASLSTHVTICGGAGNDWLRAGRGNDFIGGGSGDDTLVAGPEGDGRDVLAGNEGTDLVTYEARSHAVEISLDADTADGAPGEQDDVRDCVENLRGGSGDDVLEGSAGANDIDGGAGNDLLRETVGGDVLRGGAGDDLFEQTAEPVGTRMLGEAGVDLTSYELRSEAVVVTLCCDESGASCLADDGAEDEGDTLAGIEVVSGGWGDDRLEGCEASERLFGNEGNDVLGGKQGDDALFGGAGHDTLRGGAGDDYLDDMMGTNHVDAGEGEGDTCSVNCAVPESCEF